MSPGIYGETLAKVFRLETAPAFVSRRFMAAEIAVTELKCYRANNGFTQPIPPEDAVLLTVQLETCPEYLLWVDDQSVPTGPLCAGAACLYDLRARPVAYSISPFHTLTFYLPGPALDAVAQLEDAVRSPGVGPAPGTSVDDHVIRGLSFSLLPAFHDPETADPLFVDHINVAMASHIVRTYGRRKAVRHRSRAGLAPAQERRAKELLDDHSGGTLTLSQLATECGLPISDFLRSFRRSTGGAPHEWLAGRRIDRALDLMRRSRLSLDEIASACGYCNRRHFARAFEAKTGVAPEAWERTA